MTSNGTTRNLQAHPDSIGTAGEFIGKRAPARCPQPLKIVILGMSLGHSAGREPHNHYAGLVRELRLRGHDVLILEPGSSAPGSASREADSSRGRFSSVRQLKDRFGAAVREANLVLVASGLPAGAQIGEWLMRVGSGVRAFYDLDPFTTVAKLERDDLDYLSRALIPRYDIYFSAAGGPILELIEDHYGSPQARALYASVDPELYYPEPAEKQWDLGYLGTYREELQPGLDELLLKSAQWCPEKAFVVAGSQYPRGLRWPENVNRQTHLSSSGLRAFYNRQRFALSVSPADTVAVGYAPAPGLFEAVACGTPVISDYSLGLESLLEPDREILIASSARETLSYLLDITETERAQIAARARARVLANHTVRHRALDLECCVLDLLEPARCQAPVAEPEYLLSGEWSQPHRFAMNGHSSAQDAVELEKAA